MKKLIFIALSFIPVICLAGPGGGLVSGTLSANGGSGGGDGGNTNNAASALTAGTATNAAVGGNILTGTSNLNSANLVGLIPVGSIPGNYVTNPWPISLVVTGLVTATNLALNVPGNAIPNLGPIISSTLNSSNFFFIGVENDGNLQVPMFGGYILDEAVNPSQTNKDIIQIAAMNPGGLSPSIGDSRAAFLRLGIVNTSSTNIEGALLTCLGLNVYYQSLVGGTFAHQPMSEGLMNAFGWTERYGGYNSADWGNQKTFDPQAGVDIAGAGANFPGLRLRSSQAYGGLYTGPLPTIGLIENLGTNLVWVDDTGTVRYLVDAANPTYINTINSAVTISNNVIPALNLIGNNANYVEINVQDFNPAGSSDLNAATDKADNTTNFVDVGINGSGYIPGFGILGSTNDEYLIGSGRNFFMDIIGGGMNLYFTSQITTNSAVITNASFGSSGFSLNTGSFTGNGSGLTGLNATNIIGLSTNGLVFVPVQYVVGTFYTNTLSNNIVVAGIQASPTTALSAGQTSLKFQNGASSYTVFNEVTVGLIGSASGGMTNGMASQTVGPGVTYGWTDTSVGAGNSCTLATTGAGYFYVSQLVANGSQNAVVTNGTIQIVSTALQLTNTANVIAGNGGGLTNIFTGYYQTNLTPGAMYTNLTPHGEWISGMGTNLVIIASAQTSGLPTTNNVVAGLYANTGFTTVSVAALAFIPATWIYCFTNVTAPGVSVQVHFDTHSTNWISWTP